jgi:hypothetical protein
MTNFLNEIINTLNSSLQGPFITMQDSFSSTSVDSLSNLSSSNSSLDSSENVNSINNLSTPNENSKSYIVDKITITPNELSSIKINNLSEFMRKEILQYHIGSWNKQSPSSVKINLPLNEVKCILLSKEGTNCGHCTQIANQINKLNETTLDKLTFQFNVSDTNKNFKNLKDYWPVNGADLAIKAEDGLRIRSLLGLSKDQEIQILTIKKIPQVPQIPQTSLVSEVVNTQLNSSSNSQVSLVSGFRSMNDPELFYNSSNSSRSSLTTLHSQETKPNNFTVEEYHAYLNKPLPQEPVLTNREFRPRPFSVTNLVYIQGQVWTHSTIFEVDTDSLGTVSSNRTSLLSTNSNIPAGQNPYAYIPNNALSNEIYNSMTSSERAEVDLINLQSTLTRSNTAETSETLVNPNSSNSSEGSNDSNSRVLYQTSESQIVGLLERDHKVTNEGLGFRYRRNSLLELPRTSSPEDIESNLIIESPKISSILISESFNDSVSTTSINTNVYPQNSDFRNAILSMTKNLSRSERNLQDDID